MQFLKVEAMEIPRMIIMRVNMNNYLKRWQIKKIALLFAYGMASV